MASARLTGRSWSLGSASPSVSRIVSMYRVAVNALARFFLRPAGHIARRESALGLGAAPRFTAAGAQEA